MSHFPQASKLVLKSIGVFPTENPLESLKKIQTKHQVTQLSSIIFNQPISLSSFFQKPQQQKNDLKWIKELKIKNYINYLERPQDRYFKKYYKKYFDYQECLGANLGVHTLKTQKLINNISSLKKTPITESFTKINYMNISQKLGISQFRIAKLNDLSETQRTKEMFLDSLEKSYPELFLYAKDFKKISLQANSYLFCFIGAFSYYLHLQKKSVALHRKFPRSSLEWPIVIQ